MVRRAAHPHWTRGVAQPEALTVPEEAQMPTHVCAWAHPQENVAEPCRGLGFPTEPFLHEEPVQGGQEGSEFKEGC